MSKAKRPTDINQRAKSIVDIATGEGEDKVKPSDEIRAAASALGKLGGIKGGKARAKKLSPERRSEIAKKAAKERWKKESAKKICTSRLCNIFLHHGSKYCFRNST